LQASSDKKKSEGASAWLQKKLTPQRKLCAERGGNTGKRNEIQLCQGGERMFDETLGGKQTNGISAKGKKDPLNSLVRGERGKKRTTFSYLGRGP